MSGDDGQSAADDSRVETVVASTDRRTLAAEQSATRPTQRSIAIALAVWGLGYACYRAYYAAGGEVGMFGVPMSAAQFRAVNAVGAGIILIGALLPLLLVRTASWRSATSVLAWIVGVGCCMHAFVDGTLRLLSLTGVHLTQLPADLWQSFDRRAADLQDLMLNEPWFPSRACCGSRSVSPAPRPLVAGPGSCRQRPRASC